MKKAMLLAAISLLSWPAAARANFVLYGSPGPEQALLQRWIDGAHTHTPNVRIRLYEGNCPGIEAEANESEEEVTRSAVTQTCAALTDSSGVPTRNNEAIWIPHMSWHPEYPQWWWHLSLLNELGHVYDDVLGERDHHRWRFSAIYDYEARWWFPVNMAALLNTEWEKWSMAYAFCGYGMNYDLAHWMIRSGRYAGFGFDPSRQEYRRTCHLIGTLLQDQKRHERRRTRAFSFDRHTRRHD